MHAFLVLDKPTGMSSQSAVTQVRKILQIKKAGHTGTLDPLATGVLPIAFGEATKVIPYLQENQKIYRVTALMGASTNTYDAEGEIVEQNPYDHVDRQKLSESLLGFLGEIPQVPPLFSAIKIKGKSLYRYARQGLSVEIPTRMVRMDEIILEDFSPPYFTLKVICGKGTYIRSLIHDIGQKLACGAHITSLARLKSGPFEISRAYTLDQIREKPDLSILNHLTMTHCLSHLPAIQLEEDELEDLQNGKMLDRWKLCASESVTEACWMRLEYLSQVCAVLNRGPDGEIGFKRVLKWV